LRAQVEAGIDFADQEIELIAPDEIADRAGRLGEAVRSLAGSGPVAPPPDGVLTAICGRPNAGKSSLLNALAGERRAIVTHVAGTTRDTIEHRVTIDGVLFRLVDTAGVSGRIEADAGWIEREAARRARAAIASAQLVLYVIDGARPWGDGPQEPRGGQAATFGFHEFMKSENGQAEPAARDPVDTGAEDLAGATSGSSQTRPEQEGRTGQPSERFEPGAVNGAPFAAHGLQERGFATFGFHEFMKSENVRPPPVVTILNKRDLGLRVAAVDEARLAERGPVLAVSARRGEGLDALRAEMVRLVRTDAVAASAHGFWTTARHRAALRRAAAALSRAADAREMGLEFVAADLHDALAALGEIVGRATPDDVLDVIFSQFCIGK
jgi:tRNA U34 5-carboxymethylaminomethyl modifying GTPase MnmE/TrmE